MWCVKTGSGNKKMDLACATLKVGNHNAICVSSIFLTLSTLLTENINPKAKVKQCSMSGILHKQEWECFFAFICMSFNCSELHGLLTNDAIFFSTKSFTTYKGM